MDKQNLRDKFGAPSPRAVEKVVPYMDEWVQAFIQNSPFAVISTADKEGNPNDTDKEGSFKEGCHDLSGVSRPGASCDHGEVGHHGTRRRLRVPRLGPSASRPPTDR